MKIINTGSGYKVYDDSLKTFDQLPAQVYSVAFDPRSGFSLVKYSDIEIKEKTYGVHETKVNKVLKSFKRSERNLGIILSGDKGIGKSLFAKMLSAKGINEGYPVIIVDTYIQGIASFINSIEQEVFILFDEFDKTFGGGKGSEETLNDPQTEMLTLFDGVSQGKKMFIITCNDLRNLNNYLVNRPGRFHYHFRFEYPDADAITQYLTDKNINKEEIEKVIQFSSKVKLNYDCLRAIAFELIDGSDFEEAIKDLNIINLNKEKYNIICYFSNGIKVNKEEYFDLFSNEETSVFFKVPKLNYYDLGLLYFNPIDLVYDVQLGGYKITKNNGNFEFDSDVTCIENVNKDDKAKLQVWKDASFEYAIIKPIISRNIHYTV